MISNYEYYAITGANSGLGAEAVRQLAEYATLYQTNTSTQLTIYLLCRNVDSAAEIIQNIYRRHTSPENDHIKFTCIKFDASNRSSVKSAVEELSNNIPYERLLDGLLLNAGGFTSDRKGCLCESGATVIAETNLIGHAALVDGLIESKRIGKGCRVIFSGSEAALGEPFQYKWGDDLECYVNTLNGKRYKKYSPADGYGHIKALIAFYCTAIARRHSDIYFATISPGSTRNTNLIDQGSFSGPLQFVIKGFIRLSGQHDVSVGAKRYIDALLPDQEGWNYSSGSFVLSKKGYIGDVCVATELKKGKVFSDESKQEYVYQAVQQFL